MFAHVVAFGFGLDQPFLRRANRGGVRAYGLADARQFGLCLLKGDLEGLRVDAKQYIAGLHPLIVDNIHLDHPAGNFRRHAHHEGLDGRLRRVRREPVGDDRIEEQNHDQAENDQRPPPYGIARGLHSWRHSQPSSDARFVSAWRPGGDDPESDQSADRQLHRNRGQQNPEHNFRNNQTGGI